MSEAKAKDSRPLADTLDALRAEIEVIEGAIDMMSLARGEAMPHPGRESALFSERIGFLQGVLEYSAGLARKFCEEAQDELAGGAH